MDTLNNLYWAGVNMSRLVLISTVLVFLCSFFSNPLNAKEKKGYYTGDLILKFLGDGRNVQLVKAYSYKDPKGITWNVPKGVIVNGASIPRPLWGIIGGPFEGKFRNASVIHDYYCEKKNKTWSEVHKVFYNAMLTSGVTWSKARLMYAAVYRFGPRWEKGTRSKKVCTEIKNGLCTIWKQEYEIIERKPKFIKEDLLKLIKAAKNKDMSLEALEKLADNSLKEQTLNEFE